MYIAMAVVTTLGFPLIMATISPGGWGAVGGAKPVQFMKQLQDPQKWSLMAVGIALLAVTGNFNGATAEAGTAFLNGLLMGVGGVFLGQAFTLAVRAAAKVYNIMFVIEEELFKKHAPSDEELYAPYVSQWMTERGYDPVASGYRVNVDIDSGTRYCKAEVEIYHPVLI